jgi:hypothetical protein
MAVFWNVTLCSLTDTDLQTPVKLYSISTKSCGTIFQRTAIFNINILLRSFSKDLPYQISEKYDKGFRLYSEENRKMVTNSYRNKLETSHRCSLHNAHEKNQYRAGHVCLSTSFNLRKTV